MGSSFIHLIRIDSIITIFLKYGGCISFQKLPQQNTILNKAQTTENVFLTV